MVRRKEDEKAEGCEVSFSFSSSRIFQLQWLVLIEEQEQPGSPTEKGTSTARFNGSFKNAVITHYSKLLPITQKKEIINKRNQCAFSLNHGTTVCEAATWMLTAWDDLYYTNEIREMFVIIK